MKSKSEHRARRVAAIVMTMFLSTLASGCMHHSVHVEPVTIAPMRVTMDVNLHVDDARETSGGVAPASGAPPVQ